MIRIEIDKYKISRLDEIKEKRLHNYPESWSRFLTDVVLDTTAKPVTMAYVLSDDVLIGWAYIRYIKANDKSIVYESGSFIEPHHRRNGHARIALKELVNLAKRRSNDLNIQIRAQSHTKTILKELADKSLKVSHLY